MSLPVRQSNLFAAEDFTKVYRAFKDVDFKSYDFDSIRAAMVEYLRQNYPEDFNDFIDSSEYVAIIELLAFMGTSLAFRTDLNSRENFLDTAERRESILRLARMLSYTPSRNRPAKGLMKLSAVSTNEPITDSVGRDLRSKQIFWNDVNNPDAFEQFVTVLNAAFNSTNTFGRPVKESRLGNIQTDLYRINLNTDSKKIVFPITVRVQGSPKSVDIVNVDISDIETFEERKPDPSSSFNLVYRNDGNGAGSPDSGFFLYFKQGTLQFNDFDFDFPIENRVIDIDSTNINEEDVYVQEIDDDGNVIDQWDRVPSLIGNNIIFNSMELDQRKIFSVITEPDDKIKIRFADGNFGEVPRGKFRVWYRTSANEEYQLRPNEANGYQIRIPYIGNDSQEYQLSLTFGLSRAVSNSARSETNEDIKERAPQVFYTQNRMVNSEDYNVFPLSRGNEIEKVRTINRTHAGHSRYIDINDPTGFNQNVLLFGEDGALYKEYQPVLKIIDIGSVFNAINFIEDDLETFLGNKRLRNWYYNRYVNSFSEVENNPFSIETLGLSWKTLPNTNQNHLGFILRSGVPQNSSLTTLINFYANLDSTTYRYIDEGSSLKFINPNNPDEFEWVNILSLSGSGQPSSTVFDDGPVELNSPVNDFWLLSEALPPLRTNFTLTESTFIQSNLNLQNDFGLGYDAKEDEWYLIPSSRLDLNSDFDYSTKDASSDSSWLIYLNYIPPSDSSDASYNITTRGTRYTFESLNEVRFFFNKEQRAFDLESGRAFEDSIDVLDDNSGTKISELWTYSSGNWRNGTLSYPLATGIILRARDAYSGNIVVNPSFSASTIDDITINAGLITFDNSYVPVNGDTLSIEYDLRQPLSSDISWWIDDAYILEDGYQDNTKVEVSPADFDYDGVPNRPLSFDEIVSPSDRVFFERYTDFDNYSYFRPWKTGQVSFDNATFDIFVNRFEIGGFSIFDTGLYLFPDYTTIEQFVADINASTESDKNVFLLNIDGKIVFDRSTELFYKLSLNIATNVLEIVNDSNHYVRVGRSFNLNTLDAIQEPFHFRWKHYAPRINRIDPSISNIMDMYILTKPYYNLIQLWKKENKGLSDYPIEPTSEDLRIQFSDFNEFKMLSDEIVYHPARFKVLFGRQAAPELQAIFKIVKLPTTSLTDNEIKSRVIDAIDEYFDIRNWDFGEGFYFTELSSYIHNKLATIVATVVIVPQKATSQFGDLFQIKAEPNELFLSTARVDNVEIVNSLTDVNLRQNPESSRYGNSK